MVRFATVRCGLTSPGVYYDVATRSKNHIHLVSASPAVGVRKASQNVSTCRDMWVSLAASRNGNGNRDRFATRIQDVEQDFLWRAATATRSSDRVMVLVTQTILGCPYDR